MRKQSQAQTIVLFIVLLFLFLLKSIAGNAQALSPEELEGKPVVQSFEEALQTPTEVYRLFLCFATLKTPVAEVEKLVNLHEIYLDSTQVKSFATHLPKLKALQTVFVEASTVDEAEKGNIKQLLAGMKVVFDF